MTQLPHNAQAERAVLAAVMINSTVLDDVGDLVTATDFYIPGHGADTTQAS